MASHRMYSKLVNDKDDITGLIAYALYKQQKIEFIQKVRKDSGGDEPTEEAIKAFIQSSSTDYQIKSYREQADNMLNEIVVSVSGEQIKQASYEMLQNYERKISEAVKKETPTDLKTIGLNVLGTFLFSVIVTIILLLSNFSERFTKDVVDGVVTTLTSEAEQVTPAVLPDSIQVANPK